LTQFPTSSNDYNYTCHPQRTKLTHGPKHSHTLAKKESDQRAGNAANVNHRGDIREAIRLLGCIEGFGLQAKLIDKRTLSNGCGNETLVEACCFKSFSTI
jgi:hypothetical protein